MILNSPQSLFVEDQSFSQKQKEEKLFPFLFELTEHHRNRCSAYKRIIDLAFPNYRTTTSLSDLPYLPISLFKHRTLRSVSLQEVRLTVQSSGTTGLTSKIALDYETAQLSSKALAFSIQRILGKERLAMLIIDDESSLHSKGIISARTSAVLGLMPFGRNHCFAFDSNGTVNQERVKTFLRQHSREQIFIFGFTFMVWKFFVDFCERESLDFSRSILLHSGGWKKLTDIAVNNETFKARLRQRSGVQRIYNFYGMAELPGIILIEDESGLLFCPTFAEIIIRDPITQEKIEDDKPGQIQILSTLSRSYPGHSLLTEDIGTMTAIRRSNSSILKGLKIVGRAPHVELRGCSDVLG